MQSTRFCIKYYLIIDQLIFLIVIQRNFKDLSTTDSLEVKIVILICSLFKMCTSDKMTGKGAQEYIHKYLINDVKSYWVFGSHSNTSEY
jgi:hypothetical protein